MTLERNRWGLLRRRNGCVGRLSRPTEKDAQTHTDRERFPVVGYLSEQWVCRLLLMKPDEKTNSPPVTNGTRAQVISAKTDKAVSSKGLE